MKKAGKNFKKFFIAAQCAAAPLASRKGLTTFSAGLFPPYLADFS